MKLHATLGNRYSSLKFLLGVHLDFLSFFLLAQSLVLHSCIDINSVMLVNGRSKFSASQ
jgi:hypothetical protein